MDRKTQQQKLHSEAEQIRKEADQCESKTERDRLRALARQRDVLAVAERWAQSPGLKMPE